MCKSSRLLPRYRRTTEMVKSFASAHLNQSDDILTRFRCSDSRITSATRQMLDVSMHSADCSAVRATTHPSPCHWSLVISRFLYSCSLRQFKSSEDQPNET